MAARRRKRSRGFGGAFTEDPNDGLEINRLNDGRRTSCRSTRFSMFDSDCIVVELEEKRNGRRYHLVSVCGEVRHANVSKTRKMNGYKEFINRRNF